ncbi:MAG: 30S ribosomal protein S8, partial [Sandaracinaceae bacterium]|nr:30S ribosomal protein S8 [Sandaracinaceae bacterium]
KLAIARILKEEGYINEVEVKGREMVIHLKYGMGKQPTIRGIKRVSKPGRRMYVGVDSIPSVMSGHGISILSTSKGILTDKQAKRLRAGGELICQVW